MQDTTMVLDYGELANGFTYTIAAGITLAILNFAATRIYNFFADGTRNFIWQTPTSPLEKLINPKSSTQLKNRIKILLIDNELSLNVDQFNSEGYSLDYWDKAKNLKDLLEGTYDIIILDIKDVATELSPEDGFGLLQTIKNHNPFQIVIAFSAHSYDLSKKKFWDLADDAVDKPAGFLEMKDVLDNIINSRFDPKSNLAEIRSKLRNNNIKRRDILKIESSIASKIKKKKVLSLETDFSIISNKTQRNQLINMMSNFVNFYTDYETN